MSRAAKIFCIICAGFLFLSPVNGAWAAGASATDELAFWNQIKDSGDAGMIKGYLIKFPNGMFYDLALAKYQSLGGNPADLKQQNATMHMAANKKPGSGLARKTHAKAIAKHTKRIVKRHAVLRMASHKVRHKRKLVHLVKQTQPAVVDPFQNNQGHGGGGGSGNTGGWGGGG